MRLRRTNIGKPTTRFTKTCPNRTRCGSNDCLITKANVLDAKVAQPFVADIVIDQSQSERLAVTSNRDGKIVDIGDLPAVSARLTINASNSLIIPGQFTLVRDWKPGTAFDERRVAELLAHGTTTVLGIVDLGDRNAIEAIATPQTLPFNWAFVGNADTLGRLKPSEVVEHIAIAFANGVIAVVSTGTDETLWKHVNQFGLPLIKSDQLPEQRASSHQDAAKQAWSIANALKQQSRRGRINREYFADLLFFNEVSNQKAGESIDWKKLARVMVAGETVWENGTRSRRQAGHLFASHIDYGPPSMLNKIWFGLLCIGLLYGFGKAAYQSAFSPKAAQVRANKAATDTTRDESDAARGRAIRWSMRYVHF